MTDFTDTTPFPCARFIKEIGRGPNGARALTPDDTHALYAAMLDGRVSDLELGAILLAYRVKGESADELAAMLAAAHASFTPIDVKHGAHQAVSIPSYNGARKQPNLVPLLALLLAREGVPVLVHGERKLAQSGVILSYLARRSGKFLPDGEDEELEALRWMIFDNQKVNGFLGPFRFLKNFAKPAGDPAVMAFLKGRIDGSLVIVNKRLSARDYLVARRPTVADVSLTAYLYYPANEFGFDIARDYPAIGAWMTRMKALPGWKHPYELMPGYPFGTRG